MNHTHRSSHSMAVMQICLIGALGLTMILGAESLALARAKKWTASCTYSQMSAVLQSKDPAVRAAANGCNDKIQQDLLHNRPLHYFGCEGGQVSCCEPPQGGVQICDDITMSRHPNRLGLMPIVPGGASLPDVPVNPPSGGVPPTIYEPPAPVPPGGVRPGRLPGSKGMIIPRGVEEGEPATTAPTEQKDNTPAPK